ncbi:hypothetical protein BT63DRAFT_428074 [Microthyrium microscopicum]|uniref:Uncharacterized protein n=1 Tax=Microthyrium microscopicum TaxID=703497 RepID=A0A6A6U5A0_9PEZI|nr:hypothetical protein BT63DRAFT_428074 [Microthyrium microscopicum]
MITSKRRRRTDLPGKSAESSKSYSIKRRKTGRASRLPMSKKRLSPLERLPTEVLELVFFFCPNPALPKSSPLIGRALSSRTFLLLVCKNLLTHHLWLKSMQVEMAMYPEEVEERDEALHAIYERLQTRAQLLCSLFEEPWADLVFMRSFIVVQEQVLDKMIAESDEWACNFSESYFDDERLADQSLSFYWRDRSQLLGLRPPAKLLTKHLSADEVALYKLLVSEFQMRLDVFDFANIQDASFCIVNFAIPQKQWFMLQHLLHAPGDSLSYYCLLESIDTSRREVFNACWARNPIDYHHYPAMICHRGNAAGYVKVTQDMVRSAVLEHGCHFPIVSTLLAHSLYSHASMNYLDEDLWTWAETEQVKGPWLQRYLRNMADVAEHIQHDPPEAFEPYRQSRISDLVSLDLSNNPAMQRLGVPHSLLDQLFLGLLGGDELGNELKLNNDLSNIESRTPTEGDLASIAIHTVIKIHEVIEHVKGCRQEGVHFCARGDRP